MPSLNHKRGRSFESGLPLKSKDDDLMLFNEVQIHERDSFLLHPSDDFEDSLSKLKHFSNFKLDVSIPARGKGSDLLDVESEKNDYDWLLTPPETPLFPTLDDEDSHPSYPMTNSILRSHPIPILKLGTDSSYHTSQSNYSPQKLSPCSRSSGAFSQTRGRSFSSQQSSSPPIIRRSFTPPNKASTRPIRATIPPLRRMSTGSNVKASSYGGRGASPVKSSHGYSSSSKSQERQIAVPSYSSERPPNRLTSLLDQPVLRGSSPTSKNRKELLIKQRSLMSPTRSRSISSSHSHERNHFSFYSKRSSPPLDDEESMHSAGIYKNTAIRKDRVSADEKGISYSRNQSRAIPSTSAPKRLFDSALRLTDQHRMPQSMFRPLLSSVPATTFRPIFSKNSSLTTSSNASSEQGASIAALDMEGSELEQKVALDEWKRGEDFGSNEEIFLFDSVDQITKNINNEALSGKHQNYEDFSEISRKEVISEDNVYHSAAIDGAARTVNLKSAYQFDIIKHSTTAVCFKCGKNLNIDNAIAMRNLCEECDEDEIFIAKAASSCIPLTENEPALNKDDNERVKLDQQRSKTNLGADFFLNNYPLQDQIEFQLSDQYMDIKNDLNITPKSNHSAHSVIPNLKFDVLESAGVIDVLQWRSTGSKWPILHGKSFSAMEFLFSESSYSKINVNPLSASFGPDRFSDISSIDLGFPMQTETCAQLDLNKNEVLGVERNIDNNAKSVSSDNGDSTNSYKSRHLINEFEEKVSSSTEALGCITSSEMIPEILAHGMHNKSLDQLNLNYTPPSSFPVIFEEYRPMLSDNCMAASCCETRDLNHQTNDDLSHSSASDYIYAEECTGSLNVDRDLQNNGHIVQNGERASDSIDFSERSIDQFMVTHTFQNATLDASTHSSSSVGTYESQSGFIEIEEGQTVCMYSHEPSLSLEHSKDSTMIQISKNGISLCSSESIPTIHENELFAGESTITIEGTQERRSRNLTLDEATDTILFCSSIIHNIAYEATTISMGKSQEAHLKLYSPPKVTILEKSIPGLWEELRKIPNKRPQRSKNPNRKKMEAPIKPPLSGLEQENDVIIKEFTTTASKTEIAGKVENSMEQKMESKCSCSVM